MLNTNKVFSALKLGVTIFAFSSLYSCTPYRYFPSRIQEYSFDTCKEVRLVLEPYMLSANLAYNVGGAYSITNHFALSANYHRDKANSCCGDPKEGSVDGWTSGKAYNFGVGYFHKFNFHNGVDLFAQYEHERVNGSLTNSYYYYNNKYDTVNYKYHSISLQPSYYFKQDDNYTIGILCRATMLIDNYFTKDSSNNQITVTRHYKLGDFIVTPGIQIKAWLFNFGFFYNWDTSKKSPEDYFYRPLILNMKLVIPISKYTKRNKTSFLKWLTR